MKMKSTIAIAISAVMLLTNVGSFSVFADDVNVNDTTSDMIENYQGVSGIQRKDYILPYSFEEFLALSDEEFLALEDVPQSVKEYYEQNRGDIYSSIIWGVGFYLDDDVEFVETDRNSEAWEKELCEVLGIPFEIVQYVDYRGVLKPYRIRLKDEPYMGYSAGRVKNKVGIYLNFHEDVFECDFEYLCWTPDFTPGDIDLDGEVGVTDVVMLQKWLLGSGELQNWQSADIHQDDIINIYDLILLKRMLIEE